MKRLTRRARFLIAIVMPLAMVSLVHAQEKRMVEVDGHGEGVSIYTVGLRHMDGDDDDQQQQIVEEEVITVPVARTGVVREQLESDVFPLLRQLVDSGLVHRAELRERKVEEGLQEIRLVVTYPPASVNADAQEEVASRRGREAWLQGISGDPSRNVVDTKMVAGFSDSQLQGHAAEIYVSYIALSLLDARKRAASPREEGRRVGSLFAQYKEPQRWGRASHRLAYHALAKVANPAYELEYGHASFTLRSRYDRLQEYLAFYDASMEDYVAWLEGLHEAIGAVEGYAMTAEIKGDWLVETYRDRPRPDLVSATDLPHIEVIPGEKVPPEERELYAGTYLLRSTTGNPAIQWEVHVWEENGRLWIEWHRVGERVGHGLHLVPLEEGTFAPGWHSESGPPALLPGQTLRFVRDGARPTKRIDWEVVREGETVLYRFSRHNPEDGSP